jgi:methyl-accepting chemotaxis protein
MAKSSAEKSKPANGAAADGPPGPESLDQVRDILFGGQMRMVDSRLRGLEERLFQEQTAIKNDFQRKLSDLEVSIKKELAGHADRLKEERAKRAEDLKALGADFNEARKNFDRRQQQLEEAAGLADAELRDQLIKQGAALSAELSRTAQKISAELDRSATALRTEKLDTAALASALTDMASKLTGNHRASGKGHPRA